jgi:pyruvate dehydrogenase E2 component (dihydrolipoamide acetyltransferase)
MAKEFRLQDPGEGIHEVEIREVLVAQGDSVDEGQGVLVVESDKAAIEVPAPWSGIVQDIRVEEGGIAEVGDVLMTFETDAEDAADESPREEEAAAPTEDRDREEPGESAEPEETAREPRPSGETERPLAASPVARRLAQQHDVDLHEVEPTGPHGRVLADDVRAAAGEQREAGAAKEERAKAPSERPSRERRAPGLPDFAQWGEVERQKLRSIRRATARHMARSWAEIPHVTHQDVADVTALDAFRRRHAADVEERGGKLTLTVFALKAAVAALKEHPRFNASLDADAEEIVLKRYYHLGVAIDTEQGLMVPVLREVDRKSIVDLAVELAELTECTRNNGLEREQMAGGTFTITNVGPLGGTAFAPIVNHPQVAILGLARARWEPVVEGDPEDFAIVPRLRLPLCLAFDHRVVDGADAARFTRMVADTLADVEAFALVS